MTTAAWTELGIEPTRDARAIRRAYAVRLKQTRPESDPDGFTRLRAALETALRLAGETVGGGQVTATFQASTRVSVIDTPPTPNPETQILQLAGAGRAAEAADALAEAIDRGTLSLTVEMALKDRLLLALIHDRSLGGSRLGDLARRLGWVAPDGDASGTGDAAMLRDLDARMTAERWYDQLVETAASPRYPLGDEPAAAARLLIGKGDPCSRLLPPCAELKRQLSLYRLHRRWIEHRFDPARIAVHENMSELPYPGRLARFIWRLLQFSAIMATVAASSMFFLAFVLMLPYCKIQGYSRPGLAAYAAIAVACVALSSVLPAGLVFLMRSGENLEGGQPLLACSVLSLCFIIAAKQLFLPGRRVR